MVVLSSSFNLLDLSLEVKQSGNIGSGYTDLGLLETPIVTKSV